MIILAIITTLIGALKALADDIQSNQYYRENEWMRKYKISPHGKPVEHGDRKYSKLRKLYNHLFRVKYQEKFFLSTTALVFATDIWHETNFVSHIMSIIAIIYIHYSGAGITAILLTSVLSYLVGFHSLNYFLKK